MSPNPKWTQSSVVNSAQLTQPFFKQIVIPWASASAALCDNHLPTWVPQSAFCRKCWKVMPLLEMSIVSEQPPIAVLYVVQPKRTENRGLVVPTSICLVNYFPVISTVTHTFWLYSHLLCREGATGANIQMYAYLSPLNQLLYKIHASFFVTWAFPTI